MVPRPELAEFSNSTQRLSLQLEQSGRLVD